jgi:hypothetical protein
MNNTKFGRAAITAITTLLIAACSTQPSGPALGDSHPPHMDTTSTHESAGVEKAYPTTAQVLDAVKAAEGINNLPDSVAASLTTDDEVAVKDRFDCRPVDNPAHAEYFGECAVGDERSAKLMVVYGDSHASMWAAALANVANDNGWKLRLFSLGGCPGPDLKFLSSQTRAPNENCDTFHVSAMASIQALHPDLVIVTSYSDELLADSSIPTPSRWQQGLESMFNKLAQPGTRLAMLGNIPMWSNNDARCLAAHVTAVQECSASVAEGTPANLDAERAAASAAGALYIPTLPWVCAERCEPVIADIRVFNNQYHFTRMYTDYVTGALGEALRPALT